MAKYFIWLPYMCVFGVKSDRLLVEKIVKQRDDSKLITYEFDSLLYVDQRSFEIGYEVKMLEVAGKECCDVSCLNP